MQEVSRVEITAKGVYSLCWDGEELVDWVAGETRYRLDGTIVPCGVIDAYGFTEAILSPDKLYSVLYEKTGTKGLVLKNGSILREINRSFYHADDYEYPVALFTLPNGRPGLIHCPEKYNKLEIEEVESGERLSSRKQASIDFFHSRLQVSRDNRFLLSTGWIWHPFDYVMIYDLNQILAQPELLDSEPDWNLANTGTELHNAAFLDNERVVFTSGDAWYEAEDEEHRDDVLSPEQIGIYHLRHKIYDSLASLPGPSGRLMPFGDVMVGFYEHPRLIDMRTGETLQEWPDLATGKQNSSIYRAKTPPLALDAANQRFAVADNEKITIVQLQ